MADDSDDAEKTEEPSQRKLDEAAKQGDAVKSPEVNTLISLGAATLAVTLFGHSAAESFAAGFRIMLEQPDQIVLDPGGAMMLARHVVMSLAAILAPTIGLLLLAGIAGHVMQAPPAFAPDRLSPDISKLSPLKGFQRLFGIDGMINLVKGLIKMTLVGAALWSVLWPERGRVADLLDQGPRDLAGDMVTLAIKIAMAVLSVLALIAVVDYTITRIRFFQRHRMSRQEMKDEQKQSDGDPHIKARIRQLRLEKSRRRMMAKVPQATVVIMNPTHYAVALQYEQGKTAAPLCVAKGVDAVALRIRDKAKEHGVPVVENPPLARALYAAVEIDEPIPAEHYKAVAQVIGYVLKLSGRLRN